MQFTKEIKGVELTIQVNSYVPYSPPHLTADPYHSQDGEGGYSEDYEVYIGEQKVFEVLSFDVICEVESEIFKFMEDRS